MDPSRAPLPAFASLRNRSAVTSAGNGASEQQRVDGVLAGTNCTFTNPPSLPSTASSTYKRKAMMDLEVATSDTISLITSSAVQRALPCSAGELQRTKVARAGTWATEVEVPPNPNGTTPACTPLPAQPQSLCQRNASLSGTLNETVAAVVVLFGFLLLLS